MKTWRMLSSGIFLNLITLAVRVIIISHHQDDQDDHDHISGERYCGFNLWLLIAWDARLPCLGKHHWLQQYCSQPLKSEFCAYPFNLCIFFIFKWANTTETAILSLSTTEILSFSEFLQSAFTSWPSVKLTDLPSSWTEKISRRPQRKKSSLSCTVASVCAHMYFSIQLAIEKELQQSIIVNENNKYTDIQTPQNILLQIRLPLSSLTYFYDFYERVYHTWFHLILEKSSFIDWLLSAAKLPATGHLSRANFKTTEQSKWGISNKLPNPKAMLIWNQDPVTYRHGVQSSSHS